MKGMGHFATPPGPRGVLCYPPLPQWRATAETNDAGLRAAFAENGLHVQGVPATKLRRRARRHVLQLAGLDADDERPLIVTGHQPQFYHPGVWIKAFAVTGVGTKYGTAGLNLTVDHDAGALAAEIPSLDGGRLTYTTEYLVPAEGGRPLETLPAPTRARIDEFSARVEGRLATLDWPEGVERWRVFAAALRAAAARTGDDKKPPSAADVGLAARAGYEAATGESLIPDVPVSQVSGSAEFLLFFVHWVVHARELLTAYNEALAAFREPRGIRTSANPFPDLLLRDDDAVELPFWALTDAGIRRKLYARRDGDAIELAHLEGVLARLPAAGGTAAVDALRAVGAEIRPRAVPLTIFHRLFVADLFVHGTGGARYDEVTDHIIEHYFGVPPPVYAVASATVHLPLPAENISLGAVRALRHKLRDLRFNPQRYAWKLDNVDEDVAALVREKERLIDAIRVVEPRRGGRGEPSPKKALTRDIEGVNERLYAALAPVESRWRADLAALEKRYVAGTVATRRTYPFFLHAPEHMWELLQLKGNH